jgi:restriction system protein
LGAAFYREIGLRSETIRCGADGGIDAKLFQGDSLEPVAIVQCKAWNSRSVGVKPVRELLGVMAHHKIPKGIFLATGEFTNEAVAFAQDHSMDLVSGPAFMEMLAKLPDEGRQRLLQVATDGDYTTPTCPSCGIKMVVRHSERGDFWGCSNYPGCKQKFFRGNLNQP